MALPSAAYLVNGTAVLPPGPLTDTLGGAVSDINIVSMLSSFSARSVIQLLPISLPHPRPLHPRPRSLLSLARPIFSLALPILSLALT